MVEYLFQQTVVQWRLPIKADGSLGNPEIVKKFTSEWGGAGTTTKNKLKPTLKKVQTSLQEAEEL